MPLERNPIIGDTNAIATFRRATSTGKTLGYGGQHVPGADPSTDATVNALVVPFDVIRRLAFIEAMGGVIDIRLWWVITETPIEVHENDVFLITEYGVQHRYVVQMVDPELYIHDTTVCICKKE